MEKNNISSRTYITEKFQNKIPCELMLPSNEFYQTKIRKFNEWNCSHPVTGERISEFYNLLKEEKIRQLNGDPYSNASINVFLAALKASVEITFSQFETLEGKNRLDEFFRKAMKYLPVDKTVDDSKIFSVEELSILSEHCDQKTSLFIRFLYQTGMRISEALDVRMKDIAIIKDEATVRVRRGKRDKERKVEHVPLSMLRLIQSEFCSAEFLFQNVHHSSKTGRYSRSLWYKKLTSLSLTVLGRKLAPHFLRHSHATALSENGVSFGAIQKRLGHKRSSTTLEIYDRSTVKKEQLDKIMDGFDL